MDSLDWNRMIDLFEMNQNDDESFESRNRMNRTYADSVYSSDLNQMIGFFEMSRTDDDSFDSLDRNLLNRNDFFDAF